MIGSIHVDERLAREAVLQLGSGRIEFQFPPKIPSDSRRGTWDEGELRGFEPISTFKTSGPREITLEYTYIVDGAIWTTTKVAEQVKKIRGYFAQVRNAKDEHRNLIVKFKMFLHGGEQPISARLSNINIRHSETYIVPCVGGSPDVSKAFPLRTDISLDLRIWTEGFKGDDGKIVSLTGLDQFEPPEWY